jgi:hypothetical protein
MQIFLEERSHCLTKFVENAVPFSLQVSLILRSWKSNLWFWSSNEAMQFQPPVPRRYPIKILRGLWGRTLGQRSVTSVLPHQQHIYSSWSSVFFSVSGWVMGRPLVRAGIPNVTRSIQTSWFTREDCCESRSLPSILSSGPRVCVGEALVMNEIRTMASYIVQKFDMKPSRVDLNYWDKNRHEGQVCLWPFILARSWCITEIQCSALSDQRIL